MNINLNNSGRRLYEPSDENAEIIRTIIIPDDFINQSKCSPLHYIDIAAENSNTSIIMEIRKNQCVYGLERSNTNVKTTSQTLFILKIKGTKEQCSFAVTRLMAFMRSRCNIPPQQSFPLRVILSLDELKDLVYENYDYAHVVRRECNAVVTMEFFFDSEKSTMKYILLYRGILSDVCRSEILLTHLPSSGEIVTESLIQEAGNLTNLTISDAIRIGPILQSTGENEYSMVPQCDRVLAPAEETETSSSPATPTHDMSPSRDDGKVPEKTSGNQNSNLAGPSTSEQFAPGAITSKLVFGKINAFYSAWLGIQCHDLNRSNGQFNSMMGYYNSDIDNVDMWVIKSSCQPLVMSVTLKGRNALLEDKLVIGKDTYLFGESVCMSTERPATSVTDYAPCNKMVFFGNPDALFQTREEVFEVVKRNDGALMSIFPIGIEISIPDTIFRSSIADSIESFKQMSGAGITILDASDDTPPKEMSDAEITTLDTSDDTPPMEMSDAEITALDTCDDTPSNESSITVLIVRGSYESVLALEKLLAAPMKNYFPKYMEIGLRGRDNDNNETVD